MRSKNLILVSLFAFLLSFLAFTQRSLAATGCTYPTPLDSFSDVSAGGSLTATLFNKLQCAAEKAEAELGTLPKGSYADVKTRLDDAVYKTGNQTVAGQKTFSDLLTSALGTITADKQNLSLTATWNEGSTVFTLIKANVTNTASSASSLLVDLQVDSVSKFKVDRTGVITASLSGNATTATALAANPADCAANRFATTIAANGDLTCAQVNLTTSAVTGALPIAGGGTGQTAKTAAFDALSPLTALGDLIYRDGSNNVRLAGNTTTTRKFLRQTGDGVNSAAPAWDTLVSGDLPSHNHAASDINSGLLALARGGLNTDISGSGALGDLLYADAAATFARKAGNTSTTKKILMQTGTGAASAAPAWSLIDTMALLDTGLCSDGQIPKKVTGAWACATDATAGSPSLDTVANPAASKTFSMAAALLAFNWTSATPASTSVFSITDPTNNTGTGDLFDVHTSSGSALKPLRVTATGTANGVEMTTSGGLAAIGSGTITANRTSCTGTQYLGYDGTCYAAAASLWSGLGSPTANLALTMGAYTTTLTYNDTTSTVKLFKLIDSMNNTGTGYLLDVETASGSTLNPFRVSVKGDDTLVVHSDGNISMGGTVHDTQLHIYGAGTNVGSVTHAQLVLEDSAAWAKDVGGALIFDGKSDTSKRVDFAGIKGGKENATQNNDAGYMEFSTSPNPESMTAAGRFTSDQNFLLYKQLFFNSVAGYTNPGWGSGVRALQMNVSSIYSYSDASGIRFTFNSYYDGINEKYISSAAAAQIVYDGDIHLRTAGSGTAGNPISWTEAMLATGSNVKIGGTATRATTEGTKHLDVFDGTAPVGTLANGISLYSSAGEAYFIDAAGNASLQSPHTRRFLDEYADLSDPYPWLSHYTNPYLGKRVWVVMSEVIREVEKLSGKKLLHVEDLEERADWDRDQEKLKLAQEAKIAEWEQSDRPDKGPRPEGYIKQGPPDWMNKRGVKSEIR